MHSACQIQEPCRGGRSGRQVAPLMRDMRCSGYVREEDLASALPHLRQRWLETAKRSEPCQRTGPLTKKIGLAVRLEHDGEFVGLNTFRWPLEGTGSEAGPAQDFPRFSSKQASGLRSGSAASALNGRRIPGIPEQFEPPRAGDWHDSLAPVSNREARLERRLSTSRQAFREEV